MLTTIVFGLREELTEMLHKACSQCNDLVLSRSINDFPRFDQMLRVINHADPDVVFVELVTDGEGFRLLNDIQSVYPKIVIVGYAPGDEKDLQAPLGTQLPDMLETPFFPETVVKTVVGALERASARARNNIVTFLPSKAGSGSTTTALNVAGVLAHYWEKKVLLIEADLHSGYLSVVLQLDPRSTVVDALTASEELADRTWPRMVARAHGLDLLITSRGKQAVHVAPWDYQRLLTFASQRYDWIVVDLPEIVNDATEMIVRRAETIYVVATPEVPSLFLMRRRILEVTERGVDKERISVLLNRCTGGEKEIQDVQEILHRPVTLALPNDYNRVRKACLEGGLVAWNSDLSRAYVDIGQMVTGSEPKIAPPEATAQEGESFRDKMRKLFGG